MVREYAANILADDTDTELDWALGDAVVAFVKDALRDYLDTPEFNHPAQSQVFAMWSEIGSWWRIDYAEIGAAARELASD